MPFNNASVTTPESKKEPAYILSEDLRSFEGTPAADLIVAALEAKGMTPATYGTEQANSYRGFPSTSPEDSQSDTVSPIVEMLYKGLEDETMVEELLDSRTDVIQAAEGFDTKLNKLHLFDTSIIRDTETGAVIAYAVDLSADAGRTGNVILGPNALTITKRDAQ